MEAVRVIQHLQKEENATEMALPFPFIGAMMAVTAYLGSQALPLTTYFPFYKFSNCWFIKGTYQVLY